MTDTIMIKLTDVTESATVDQLKYWCKLLDIQPKIISRAAHVTTEQCETIKRMAELINQGVKPKEAAGLLVNTAVTISPVSSGEREQELVNRIESLEKAVMLLVEQNKRLTTTIEMQNEVQNKKLEAIQMRLEPPKVVPVSVKIWEPAPKKAPRYSFLQKVWYELMDPVRLRAY
ncbi:MAG: hypothetical protein ACD_39C01767G0003 [uncultured bacterium]|nr:MAG: hypothetical protein ACD_39C01767G0003 [uncultured bacterium]